MNKTKSVSNRAYYGTEEQFQDFIRKVFDGLYGTDKNRQCYSYDEAIEKIAEYKKKANKYDLLQTVLNCKTLAYIFDKFEDLNDF